MWDYVVRRRSALGCLSSLVGFLALFGCDAPGRDRAPSSTSFVIESEQDGPPTELPEVVQVLVNNLQQDFCTGVLVSPTRVLTAAHCMVGVTYTVRAPHAPLVKGTVQESRAWEGGVVEHSNDFSAEVWKEDAATVNLEQPIQIDEYPTLKEVDELGENTLRAIAVGRSEEKRNASLVKSKELEIHSGTPFGYTTGLTSRYYSSGGDSGGPVFLLDPATGKPTHVVIGIERQPDPPSEFFTRITPAVTNLVGAK